MINNPANMIEFAIDLIARISYPYQETSPGKS